MLSSELFLKKVIRPERLTVLGVHSLFCYQECLQVKLWELNIGLVGQ